MSCGYDDDDEFPDVEIIIQRHKQKTTKDRLDGDKENAPTQPRSPKSTQASFNEAIGKTPVTVRRRRKLGQGQPVDCSLRKPWHGVEVERETGSRTSGSRPSPWSRASSAETSIASTSELVDFFPRKTKRVESRAVSGGTVFDSPPEERKKTGRRLISRGEKNRLGAIKKEQEWLASSSESESGSKNNITKGIFGFSKEARSEFISAGNSETGNWGSDSDDLSKTPPQRSRSPNGPRRLQRRVLSSSRDPNMKELVPTRPIRGGPIISPKKRVEKSSTPDESTATKPMATSKGNLDGIFEKLRIFNEESEPEDIANKHDTGPILEPTTPRKTLTASPAKVPRIPMSPWKPEHKEFWDPEVNFAWIDKHSPPKKSPEKTIDLTGPDGKDDLKRRYGTSPEKKQAKKAFDAVKEDLARTFLLELDKVITEGRLAQLTESTGGLRVVWSNTLLTTAGRAHWKCKTTTTSASKPPVPSASSSSASSSLTTTTMKTTTTTTTQHYASIELATKVLSNEADLLNTVAHEFCHLAVFLLHGKPKLAHGAEFKTYGRRVMSASSAGAGAASDKSRLQTPQARGVQINVTTRHSYEIEYRFVWRCADCAAEVCRHSRSVDPTRQRCGKCKGGVLVQVKPVPRGSGTSASTSKGAGGKEEESEERGGGRGREDGREGGAEGKTKTKKKTAYQEFTSREMKALSLSHKGLSFKERMAMVSARWGEHQKLQKAKEAEAMEPTAIAVRGLTGAVEMLDINKEDDAPPDNRQSKAAYDVFM
ncbi:hypothetical protein F5Y19DRAFT_486737 [Xylariaceae sp. FL1651]|nr:hypothetical protein F5Y19DRAFT_486737 [Xylariaceae sp. FL1651]